MTYRKSSGHRRSRQFLSPPLHPSQRISPGHRRSASGRPALPGWLPRRVRQRDFGVLFEGLDSWVIWLGILRRFTSLGPRDDLTAPKAVDLLREWTGMPVTDIAELLGVARRSLYHWATGVARPRHEARLLGVVRTLRPLGESWDPWELREWLGKAEVRTAVRSGALPDLALQVHAAAATRPVHRLAVAPPGLEEEVEPLDATALGRALSAATQRRAPRLRRPGYEPPELTDSGVGEE